MREGWRGEETKEGKKKVDKEVFIPSEGRWEGEEETTVGKKTKNEEEKSRQSCFSTE